MFGMVSGLIFSPGCAVTVSYDAEKAAEKAAGHTPAQAEPEKPFRVPFTVAADEVNGEQLRVSVQAVEKALGKFNRPVPVRAVDEVKREGQALSMKSAWSGKVITEPEGPVIEIARSALNGNEDLRFYLAHARMRERGAELGCEAVRVGLAHYLRTPDGFDQNSWKLYCNTTALDLSSDLDTDRLKNDWRYRDCARGSCWAAVYYLAKRKGLSAEDIFKSSARDLPNPESIRVELSSLAERY